MSLSIMTWRLFLADGAPLDFPRDNGLTRNLYTAPGGDGENSSDEDEEATAMTERLTIE